MSMSWHKKKLHCGVQVKSGEQVVWCSLLFIWNMQVSWIALCDLIYCVHIFGCWKHDMVGDRYIYIKLCAIVLLYPDLRPCTSMIWMTPKLKPVLNWANVCSPEHTSDTSTNYDSFLNWTFSSPNMVRTVQTLLHSQLVCNEMQASARTCGRRAADSMVENVG